VIGTAEPAKENTIPDIGNDGNIVRAHYDAGRKSFWTTNSRGGWIEVSETSLRRLLRNQGFRSKLVEGESLSEVDKKLNEIVLEQDVAYAGPLAGHVSGLLECYGNRILVTTSPKLIEPSVGDWPTLRKLLDGLLVDDAHDQRAYVFGWLKLSFESIRSGRIRPAPAMILAGPRDCGKSLLQKLFTEILGGRVAKPYRYMSGRTEFNAELFGAEHLMIEDETPCVDLRSRRNLGAHIKAFTVNDSQSCHPKGRQAVTLAPFWRVSISVNDEPENLMILPPLTDSDQDSLADKIILLRARKPVMPMPSESLDDREAFWSKLRSELPAFLHFLENWEIPEHVRHSRFGIKTWQHPQLLAALDALAPETRLLVLIDEVIFASPIEFGAAKAVSKDSWNGTAEQLESSLGNSQFGHEARRLLSWPNAAGTYLGRLAGKYPNRVKPDRTSAARKWSIYRSKEPMALAA